MMKKKKNSARVTGLRSSLSRKNIKGVARGSSLRERSPIKKDSERREASNPKKNGKAPKRNVHKIIFIILLLLVFLLGGLDVAKAKGWLIPKQEGFIIKNGVVDVDSMTLEQKVAQMIIVAGNLENLQAWKNMQLGGIHLYAKENEQLFKDTIATFQEGMPVPFLVTVDMEGCQNPFARFRNSSANSDISTVGEAFQKGNDDGKFLQQVGFSMNFAPVVDLKDEIWNCRSFPGDEQKIAELAEAYLLGLQSREIIGTAKHYPGKTLVVKDPHKYVVAAPIEEEDVYPYGFLFNKGDAKAVMVSHIITSGAIDSQGVPAVVSEEVIAGIKQNFTGLVVSDEINMLGLKSFYPSLDEMYVAVFKAGNDLILNFNENPNEMYHMIQVVAEAVKSGVISEEQIDLSVKKILAAKGFSVKE